MSNRVYSNVSLSSWLDELKSLKGNRCKHQENLNVNAISAEIVTVWLYMREQSFFKKSAGSPWEEGDILPIFKR